MRQEAAEEGSPQLHRALTYVTKLLMRTFFASGLDANHAHHAAVNVLHYMTVERESAYNARIAKIHTQDHTWVFSKAIPSRQIYCVAQSQLFPSHGTPADRDEVHLMNVKSM